ncbi:hypothetical protein [Barrientosiimonas humi]|uniref:hypothetical protein n=1 Tax=Barrientosiimonas humi TaxID=999931 RepID=UPI00370D8E17
MYKIATADNGAVYVWNSSSATDYRTLVVKDNKADNASVYGNWSNSRGTGRVLNSSGAGTTAYRDTGAGITALQACVDYNNWPDPCSAWK